MGGFLQSTPTVEERDTSKRTIIVAIAVIVVVVGIVALVLREKPKPPIPPPPYAASLKISDLKLSQAQNFVGATVTYVDGTLSNAGDKTVTHVDVRVTFKDMYGQIAQVEELSIKVLRTTGPYPDTVDLSAAPLAPGQSSTFRLIFEHLSDQWNQGQPDFQITGVTTKQGQSLTSGRSVSPVRELKDKRLKVGKVSKFQPLLRAKLKSSKRRNLNCNAVRSAAFLPLESWHV